MTEASTATSASDSLSVPEADLQEALRALLLDNLPLVYGAVSVLYASYAVGHRLILPAFANTMAMVAAGTALVLALLSLQLHRHRPATRWAYPLAAVIAVAALANTLTHLYLLGDAEETTNVMLVVIGAGFLFFSSPWFTALAVTTLLGWCAVARAIEMPPGAFRHFGFALLTSTVLATLIHLVWVRALRRLQTMRLRDEMRKAELAAALAGSEAARQALERSKRELEDMVQAVQESEERFLRFTDLEGMAVHDHGVIIDANPVLARMFGYELPHILGHTVLDLIAGESRESVMEHMLSD